MEINIKNTSGRAGKNGWEIGEWGPYKNRVTISNW